MTSRKLVALVLAVVGPWGLGQFHLGRRARGLAWLAVPTGAIVIFGAALPAAGARAGWTLALAFALVALVLAWIASVVDLLRLAEGAPTPAWQTVLFALLGLAAPAGASALVRAKLLESYVVPTRSMEPSVLAGDHLFAQKTSRAPRYGDVVVFASPDHPEQMLVKRVVALPGDVLEMRRGRPWVNGWRVPSCPLGDATLGSARGEVELELLGDASYLVFYDSLAPVAEHAGPLWAASDGVLVLGDDRNDSADSRAFRGGRDGNVRISAVRGRALFVWLRASASDTRRVGVDLEGPSLPTSLESLRPALERCLANRPPSTPPARPVSAPPL